MIEYYIIRKCYFNTNHINIKLTNYGGVIDGDHFKSRVIKKILWQKF